ncbi:ABC transporter substrate-binding protein [Geobacillus thermoleovorans]|uniref:Branched-chain amino acid ABC transporter (Substrate-binding protein) n=1 Tax=Geobacillus kaustophilus (strain HTA426) TaxID=235909 RepID=Q5KZD7_GEOKA|nr:MULTISPECIES: ABC transporter substrate-binding protein [Geobacillus thermoleovorans group]MED3666898.1 ABC transporter substrate-binding protein [Geobacillus kaustophilus]OQP12951.1 ethanolamine utilization protein EutJ [Geobacillus thermoleovorans]QNU22468.1 ABC transporter substrate-binding protein [Geobacillus thermoleovorans]TLS32512.1 ethanolamine utilization protein EutJ [Geobacillus thermoleovorans]UPT59383.1 ABC transporter substrate-binding protein [Geobacillus thermoleovorans]
MKKRKWSIAAMIAAIMMLMLAACNNSPSSNNANGGNNSGGGSGETGTVNIGYSGPLSGPAAYYGQRTLNGLKMAAEEINNSGGFEVKGKKYKINLVPLDDKYLPNETAANAKRLVQEHHTPIIFTPHSGGVMALQVFNQTDNFIIAAYTSEPKITQTGNKLTVRIPPRYDGYIPTFTDYAMKHFGRKLAALPTATQYGKDWTEKLLPYWEKQGGKVVYKSSIDFTKDTDFFTIVTNALKEKPDVLFIGGPSEPTAKVAKQARELGFKGGFIIMDQAKLDEMKRVTGSYDMLEGSIGVMPLVESDQPAVPEFVKNYRAKFNEDPGSEAAYNYLALYAFVEAMKAAGTVDDPQAIREHMNDGLKNIPDEKKVYNVPSIGDDGGFESEIVVAAVENGKIVPIELIKQ